MTSLPGETCCQAVSDGNRHREVRLRRQGSAEAIVPRPLEREGPNVKTDKDLSSSRDEQRRQTSPDKGTAGRATAVKPPGLDQRAEPSPARDEALSSAGGGSVWERVFARSNLFAALQRVEANEAHRA